MSKSIYQFQITLKDIKPKIWRVIEVQSDCTFREFNAIILAAMGWEGYHLYEFVIYNPKTRRENSITEGKSSKGKLHQYFSSENKTAEHYYDFGDGWCHKIILEKELDAESGVKYPRCIKGGRACPPEDCGGPWGYEDFMQMYKKPRSKLSRDEKDRIEWFGDFDPEEFDIEEANQRLC